MSLLAFIPLIGDIIKRVIPDPDKARELELEILKEMNSASNAQIEVNKVEAAHASIFVAGWRPFIGWICGLALGVRFLVLPLLGSILPMFNIYVELPEVPMTELIGILGGLLGIGGLRTYEKIKGVSREEIIERPKISSNIPGTYNHKAK